MSEHRHRSSLVWPVVLIGIGVLFLLNNFGVIDWDIWFLLARLWPLLIVAIGLDLLLGRRTGIGSAIALLIIFALIAGGVWLARSTGAVLVGDLRVEEISQPLQEAERAKVDLNFGVGTLELESFSSESLLASGALDLAEGEQLETNFRVSNDIAYLSLKSHGQQFYPSWWFGRGSDQDREWQLRVTDSIPVELEISTGVGRSELDLTGLQLTGLDLSTGVGQVSITLPAYGSYTAQISGGVGELTVYLPGDYPIRLHVDTGLGNNRVSGDYTQSGNIYTFGDFQGADERITVYVNGGVGNVNIIQLD
jgi:hypothetical protein